MCSSEEDIRRIVREEIQEVLETFRDQADRYPNHDSDTIQDQASTMVRDVARSTLRLLRHAKTCQLRVEGSRWSNCNCGVEED